MNKKELIELHKQLRKEAFVAATPVVNKLLREYETRAKTAGEKVAGDDAVLLHLFTR